MQGTTLIILVALAVIVIFSITTSAIPRFLKKRLQSRMLAPFSEVARSKASTPLQKSRFGILESDINELCRIARDFRGDEKYGESYVHKHLSQVGHSLMNFLECLEWKDEQEVEKTMEKLLSHMGNILLREGFPQAVDRFLSPPLKEEKPHS